MQVTQLQSISVPLVKQMCIAKALQWDYKHKLLRSPKVTRIALYFDLFA